MQLLSTQTVSQNPQRSGLRPPSRIQLGTTTSSTCLQEITDSQSNSRAQNQTMLPPPGHSLKRALNPTGNSAQLPEPKRKTLVERAGEPVNKVLPAPSVSASSRLGLKGTSIANLAAGSNVWPERVGVCVEDWQISNLAFDQLKPPATAINGLTRNASVTSRLPATNNFSQSVGPGSRPPVTTTGRAPSALGFNQSVNTRQKPISRARPATAMGDRDGNGTQSQQRQPNGTTHQLSFQSSQEGTRNRGVRGSAASLGSLPSHGRQENIDVAVLEQGIQSLSIHDQKDKKPKGAQVNSKPEARLSGQQVLPDVNGGVITHRRSRNQPPKPLLPPIAWPPATPCQEKDLQVIFNKFENTMTACQSPSPLKLCSPSRSPFLTKETTTLTNFTAWDVDERLHELDSQFKQMKEVMNVSLTDRKALEDAVDLAKTRGK